VNRAADYYFDNPPPKPVPSGPSPSIQKTFDKYKDASTGNIEVEGLQRFFDDLGVNPGSDTVTFLISSKMKAANMGTFTQQEFTTGFQQMGVQSVDELKRKLPQLH